MKIKVPKEIKVSSHTYTVCFAPHLRHDEGRYGVVNHRLQQVEIETSIPPSLRDQTLLHEVIHIIDRAYVCGVGEEDVERIANGVAEFLRRNLGIELDWSDIKEV